MVRIGESAFSVQCLQGTMGIRSLSASPVISSSIAEAEFNVYCYGVSIFGELSLSMFSQSLQ